MSVYLSSPHPQMGSPPGWPEPWLADSPELRSCQPCDPSGGSLPQNWVRHGPEGPLRAQHESPQLGPGCSDPGVWVTADAGRSMTHKLNMLITVYKIKSLRQNSMRLPEKWPRWYMEFSHTPHQPPLSQSAKPVSIQRSRRRSKPWSDCLVLVLLCFILFS